MEASDRHRGDIDGLRAVAVVLVVLFHGGVPHASAGFIGVDVFFVISGYLITGILLREIDRDQRLDLARFWARRLRRLAPALGVVVLCTLIAALVVFSPLRWPVLTREAVSSVTYLSNIDFATRTRGYFVPTELPSPFLHMWSLAVEEQFYVVWPLAVVVVLAIARRTGRQFRSWFLGATVVAVLASFALGLAMTRRGSPWAYYSLPTRWWEIGVGALIAQVADRRAPFVGERRSRSLLPLVGLALLATSMVMIDERVPYPGGWAVLPVAAAACLLLGSPDSPVATLLGSSPLQQLGRLSYSWYLWHWPFIAFGVALGQADNAFARTGWAVGALVPAAATHHLIERPVRFSSVLQRSVKRSLAVGAVSVVVVVMAAALMNRLAVGELEDPFLAALVAARDDREADIVDGCPVDRAGAPCASERVIMVVGDSHAAHWVPAVRLIADELQLDLVVRVRGGCPPWDLTVAVAGTSRPSDACESFKQDTWSMVERLKPAAVIVASGNYDGRLLVDGRLSAAKDEAEVWQAAVRARLRSLSDADLPTGLILDNPYFDGDPIECLARSRDPEACRFSVADGLAVPGRNRDAEMAAAAVHDVPVFDPVSLMCDDTMCSVWSGGAPILSDHSHLTRQFVEQQAGPLRAFVTAVVDRG